MNAGDTVQPAWTTTITTGEHDLVLFGLVATALALLATLVRVRFTSAESHGTFRVASLTANAVVALALVSYAAIVLAFVIGYTQHGDRYQPGPVARLAWELRYTDWVVTVPLLVVELMAISSLDSRTAGRARIVGMVSGAAMIGCGFLGAFVVADGTDRNSYVWFGVAGAVFFAVLYVLFFGAMRASLPRLPGPVRSPYRAAVILLLITWLAYPIAYGLLGAFSGGSVIVVAQLLLCAADMIAKIGFGSLVHRAAVLRSRNDEDLDPSSVRRPRSPRNESVYVGDTRAVEFDDD